MNEQATILTNGGQPNNQPKSSTPRPTKSVNPVVAILRKIEVKLLQFYYGNPAKDLKLIIVAGNSGVNTTAHYIHETLKLADAKTGLVLNAKTPAKFYHRLAKIWRNGANHAVIAAPIATIRRFTFYNLPVHSVVVTNTKDTSDFRETLLNLFKAEPNFLIVNHDDIGYSYLSQVHVKKSTISYGKDISSDIRINRIKLYKQGTEVNLNYNGQFIDFATFVLGEESGYYMAAAATAGFAMSYSSDNIVDGIANYEPKNLPSSTN